MYKGVGGQVGGGKPEAGYSFQQDCLEVPHVQEVLVISPDKPGGPKRRVTNTGVNIRPIYLPSGALHGPHCLSHDFTWSAKPALEKQTSQLGLSMQQCTGSV